MRKVGLVLLVMIAIVVLTTATAFANLNDGSLRSNNYFKAEAQLSIQNGMATVTGWAMGGVSNTTKVYQFTMEKMESFTKMTILRN